MCLEQGATLKASLSNPANNAVNIATESDHTDTEFHKYSLDINCDIISVSIK